MRTRYGGFTLIEIAAVIVLMALMVGAVRWTMADGQRAAVLEDAIDRVRFADRQARAVARRFDRPVVLLIDLDAQTIRRIEADAAEEATQPSPPTLLSDGHKMTRVRTTGQTTDHDTVGVRIGPMGTSETYAIELENSGGRRVWLVVAGMSGQLTRIDNDDAIEAIFAALRPDAG